MVVSSSMSAIYGYERDHFMDQVRIDKKGHWLWTGILNPKGHPLFLFADWWMPANYWAYEYYIGFTPKYQLLYCKCRIRKCICPWHMEPFLITKGPSIAACSYVKLHETYTHETYAIGEVSKQSKRVKLQPASASLIARLQNGG